MKVLYQNILENYATIEATNEDGNKPIENIFSTYLTSLFGTTVDGTVITITFSEDQTADSFFLAYTNLAINSTVNVVYRNAADAILITENLLIEGPGILKSYFTQLTTIRSITITIDNYEYEGTFFIGTIWIGEVLNILNVEAYPIKGLRNFDGYQKSINGNVSGQTRSTLKAWNINIPIMETDNYLEDIENYLETIQNLPHFIDIYENVDGIHDLVLFCHATKPDYDYPFQQTEPSFKYRNINILYEEAR